MCGISGFFGDFPEQLLVDMNNSLAHRGPDNQGIYYNKNNNIGLAQTRLSIIDLSSTGHQPLFSKCRNAVITFNGEIYNYKKLKKELLQKGYKFKGNSDTEVLLNLYLEHGKKMLSLLNGIFAFAIWDFKKNQLFCARDQMGVKPFYYFMDKQGFLFASELKAFLNYKYLNKEINYKAIYYYLNFLWSPSPHTMFKNVFKLEPGEALIIEKSKIIKQWKYYNLPIPDTIKNLNTSQWINSTRENIRKAVERQMIADVPVGAFLSGGLDSSAIAAFAQSYNSSSLETFSINFQNNSFKKEGFSDDLPYAKKVANHLNVNLNIIDVKSDSIQNIIETVFMLDEPTADPAALNSYFITKLAKENNIKVLLSGTGGDDLFSGYRRHQAVRIEKILKHTPYIIRKTVKNLITNIPKSNSSIRRLEKLSRNFTDSDTKRITGYFSWPEINTFERIFTKDTLNCIFPSSNPLLTFVENIPKNLDPLEKMLLLEKRFFLADHNLNYSDKTSMQNGVEVRVPLIDLELVKFASQIPTELKQKGNISKWIFKKAMEGILPNDIIYRPKTGFGIPIREWLKDSLNEHKMDLLSKTSIENRGIFNHKSIELLIKEYRDSKKDHSYTILSLMMIEQWFRKFLDT